MKKMQPVPDFDKQGGLVPVVVQDADDGTVLMMAWMDRRAWEKTLETAKAHYFSRSRGRLWMKGETSGHIQEVKEIRIDCDRDAVLLKVVQHGGAACHTGYRSCFYTKITPNGAVEDADRIFDPKDVYGKTR